MCFHSLGPPTKGIHFIYTYSPPEDLEKGGRGELAEIEEDGQLLRE